MISRYDLERVYFDNVNSARGISDPGDLGYTVTPATFEAAVSGVTRLAMTDLRVVRLDDSGLNADWHARQTQREQPPTITGE